MSTSKTLREITKLAESLGITVEEVSRNCHIKLRLATADGRTALFVVPVSCSDRRAGLNRKAQLRRFAAGGSL